MVRQLQTLPPASPRHDVQMRARRRRSKVTPPFQQLDGAILEADVVERHWPHEAEPVLFDNRVRGASARCLRGPLCGSCTSSTWRPRRVSRGNRGTREHSGMVLINGIFLTAEVGRWHRCPIGVPELLLDWADGAGRVDAPYRLQPSRGEHLARTDRMGVRAVVAAGWAGDMRRWIRKVRRDVNITLARLMEHVSRRGDGPDSNTWGAYQAYGD
jgi:hypothetical protein